MKISSKWIEKMTFMYAYKNLRTITELDERRVTTNDIPPENIRICVIDDEGFDINPLNSLGYREVHKQFAFGHVSYYKDYDIILCDVDGIGKELNESKQGIAVAELLKERYPNIIIYLYTGKTLSDYGEKPSQIDRVITKPTTMSDLDSLFRADMKNNLNPVNYWKKIRLNLLNAGTSTKTLTFLEHIYVISIMEKQDYFSINNFHRFKTLDFGVSLEILSILSSGINLIIPFIKGI